MSKNVSGALAVVGALIAIVGFALWHSLTFSSKKLDASLALGVILLVVGIIGFVMPSKSA